MAGEYDPNLPIPDSRIDGQGITQAEYQQDLRSRLFAVLATFGLRLKTIEDDMAAVRAIYKVATLPSSVTTLFTVPFTEANRKILIEVTSIILVDIDGTDRTFTLHNVASGGSAGASNKIFDANPVFAGETIVIGSEGETLFTMESGDFLAGFASAASAVNISVYGRIRQ